MRGLRLWLALAFLLLAGCSSGRWQPLVVLETGAAADSCRVQVFAAEIGERLAWRTRDGSGGTGTLLDATADSLLLDARPRFARGGEPEEVRVALTDLVVLTEESRRDERWLAWAVGTPMVVGGLALLLLGFLFAGADLRIGS